MPPLKLLYLLGFSIHDQLVLEEALLRNGDAQYCILNTGSSPACILGKSNRIEDLVYIENPLLQKMPILRRFSGGGAVVIDEGTVFLSFVFSQKQMPCAYDPQSVLEYIAHILRPVLPDIKVHEQDFVIDGKKIGGNAQSFSKDRMVHHVSLLYNYSQEYMNILKIPQKQPNYRGNRTHENFCTTINSYFDTKDAFCSAIKNTISSFWTVETVFLEDVLHFCQLPHRRSVSKLS